MNSQFDESACRLMNEIVSTDINKKALGMLKYSSLYQAFSTMFCVLNGVIYQFLCF